MSIEQQVIATILGIALVILYIVAVYGSDGINGDE
jgi:preprotein translocase subunit SecD